MELPKHTTQVGTIGANKKLYLEDYCISYMKQLTEEFPEDRKQIALFGTVEKEKNAEYAFAYGAALLGKGRGRTDSLTNSQKEEAENIRAEFFEDYQLIGVVISTDAMNENVFWLGYGTKSIPMDGYYIFYDSNEAMLNYMMEGQKQERDFDLDPVIIKKADMDREKKEKALKEKQEAQQKTGKYRKAVQKAEKSARSEKQKSKSAFPAAACLLLLAIGGVYGVKTYYPEFGMEQVKTYFENLRGEASTLVSGYLGGSGDDLLLAENTSNVSDTEQESFAAAETVFETEEIIISTEQVEPPAQMDVVVIPEPDTLESAPPQQVSDEQTASGETVTTTEPVISENVVQQYFIKKGDNLLKILRFYYGDETKLQEICELNGIKDPNNIQVGQTILLP